MIFLCGFAPFSSAQSDILYVSPTELINLVADPFTGSIQWQRSLDGTFWSNIAGEIDETYFFEIPLAAVAGDIRYYRAVVSKDDCNFYSSFITTVVSDGMACDGLETIMDFDGNEYDVLSIGEQCWMVENLKSTHLRNGDPITTGLSNSEWTATESEAYAIYGDNPAHGETYGNLYNWYAVTSPKGLCPIGWHTPTDEEFKELELFLEMDPTSVNAEGWRGSPVGGAMKSIILWASPNDGATNESGFTGLPSGCRFKTGGNYHNIGTDTYWWTTTEYSSSHGFMRKLNYDLSSVYRGNRYKQDGFPVRCVRD